MLAAISFLLSGMASIHTAHAVSGGHDMAASKAAVATTAGGIPEVMADGVTGFLVPLRDHHAMAEKLIRLLKDESLRQRMGEAALARARSMFTVERMVLGTAAVYEKVRKRLPEGAYL